MVNHSQACRKPKLHSENFEYAPGLSGIRSPSSSYRVLAGILALQ